MNAKEKYLLDVQGYLVIEKVLNNQQLTDMNRAIDERQSRGESVQQGFLEWGESDFRDLINDPIISPYLKDILGNHYRLDHEYAIMHRKGADKLSLHGGGNPYDPGQYYQVRQGNIYSGLTVVSYALTDIGTDDGGFCCIPGSHKAAFPLPESYREYEEIGPVVHVPQKAGDVLIFTEALTHGTLPWKGMHERRSLLYKFSPSMIAWAKYERSPELLAKLTPEQQEIVRDTFHSFLYSWENES